MNKLKRPYKRVLNKRKIKKKTLIKILTREAKRNKSKKLFSQKLKKINFSIQLLTNLTKIVCRYDRIVSH